MKRYVIIGLSVLAAAMIGLLLSGCGGDRPKRAEGGPHIVPQVPPPSVTGEPDDPGEEPEDGRRTDNSDPDAPKSIASKQIVTVDCRFSTVDLAEPGVLGNHIYRLTARLENGAVKGTYDVLDTGESHAFRDDHSFLNRVRELVDRYDVAGLNGHSAEVQGLPGDYGADLEIRYGSRESISIHDNSENCLPTGFCEELAALFADAAGTELPDAEGTAGETEESKTGARASTRRGWS